MENDVSEDGISLVFGMMKSNPADRITVSNALLHPWTSGHDSTSIPCLDSYELKTSDEHDSENRIWTPRLSLNPQTPFPLARVFSEMSAFLSGSAPPPTKTHELGGETVIRLESHDSTSDLQNPDAAELEIPLDDQKSSLDLSEEDPVTIRALHKLASSYYKKGEHQKAMQVKLPKGAAA